MSDTIPNSDAPAMPFVANTDNDLIFQGMTKRERFAMAALESGMSPTNTHDVEETATWCVKQADALLKELEETQ